MTTHKLVVTIALFAGLGGACGGSSNKLSSRVNGAHLAPVSDAERAGEADAQREFFLAEWQVAFTDNELNAAKLDIKIAENELASAKLAVKNTQLELKAAEESSDRNAIADKQQAEKVATLQVEVHKIAIERAKQNKRFLEQRLAYEQKTLKSREAGVELARAKSLQSAGIRPPSFDAKSYKSQHTERAASAKAAKASVDGESAKLADVDKRLVLARNAVAAAEGNPIAPIAPPETKPMLPLGDEGTPATPTQEPADSTEPTDATPPTDPEAPTPPTTTPVAPTPAAPAPVAPAPVAPAPVAPAPATPKTSGAPVTTPGNEKSGATSATETQS